MKQAYSKYNWKSVLKSKVGRYMKWAVLEFVLHLVLLNDNDLDNGL